VISVAAAYRGWFQGMRQVSVIGGSQTIEQLVRVIIGVYLAEKLLNLGLEQAVSAASLATVCGETAGFLYLFCRFHGGKKAVFKKPKPRFSWAAAAQLLRYGMPITAGKMISSGIMMLQAFLIPLSLQVAGWDMRAATEIYGRFSGVALSMLHLPGVFTTALAVSVLPAVAESMNFAHNGRQLLAQRIGQSLTATAIFTLPGMAILFLLAEPLCTWIFANPPAAPILKLLALGGSFFYLQLTLVSILQGLGAVKPLLINNIISGLILLAGIALLTSSPRLGILGTAIAVDIAWISGMLLNLRQVIIISRVTLPWKQILIKPLLALIGALLLFFFAKTWLLSLFTNDKIAILLLSSCFFASYL
ncbi:MAG: polysaccharide biosynthesis C-terminal domain-containing protein, partial [Clostridiales bacterium]